MYALTLGERCEADEGDGRAGEAADADAPVRCLLMVTLLGWPPDLTLRHRDRERNSQRDER